MNDLSMVLLYQKDINSPLATMRPVTLMMQGDALANEIRIDLTQNGAPYEPAGYSVEARMIRSDGHKVRCDGRIEGNTVHVALDAGCYEIPGSYVMYVRLASADGSVRRTILRMAGEIESEGSGPLIDGDRVFYSVEDLLRQIDKMEEATQAAQTQAQAAQTQAQAASSAASTANTAAGKIDNMTVSAQEGDAAGARISEKNGAKHIDFTLRRGAPGHGMKILGTYETIAELSAAVTNPAQGDMYLVGVTAPYELYMYNSEGSVTGWIYLGAAQGDGVASVAGVKPDVSGNVALTAENVGARPDSWTPTAEEVGAKPEDYTPVMIAGAESEINIVSGYVNLIAASPNTVVSETVDFGFTFAEPPIVLTALKATSPDDRFPSFGDVTTTGMKVYGYRTSTKFQNIPVAWIAIGKRPKETMEEG